MAKGDVGVGILASWAVRPHVQAGNVVALPLTKKGIHRQWSAAFLRSGSTPKYVKSFVDCFNRGTPIVSD